MSALPAIACGGGLGSLARWSISQAWPEQEFPWPTLVVNVTGCVLIGLLMAALVTRWRGSRWHRPFFGVGLLGGYTTFSAYALEIHDLVADGSVLVGVAYAAGSVLAGIAAVAVGLSAGRALFGRGVA